MQDNESRPQTTKPSIYEPTGELDHRGAEDGVVRPLPVHQRRGPQRLWVIWAAIGTVIAVGFLVGWIMKNFS